MTTANGSPLVNDRPTSAYLLNAHGDGAVILIRAAARDERFYGLWREGRRFSAMVNAMKMRNLDAMGYNAVSTDPLCNKHILYPHPA